MSWKLELGVEIKTDEFLKNLEFRKINISKETDFLVEYLEDIDWITFQAIVDKKSNIVKYEVLLSWENIEKSLNTIKQENKTPELFEFVLKEVFLKIKNDDDFKDKQFSINAFPEDIAGWNFVEKLKKSLKKYNVEAKQITIEILETELFEDLEKNFLKNIRESKEMWIVLAIDDFWDKFSNRARLEQFKEYISILKIDWNYLKHIFKNIENYKTPSDKEKKRLEYYNFFKDLNDKNIQIIFEYVTEEKAKKLKSYFWDINYLIQGYDFWKKEESIK